MGKRGPPRKPTKLKLLQGTPGGKSKLKKSEPNPKKIEGSSAPSYLAPDAREVWAEMAPRLEILGLLTQIDVLTFERLCIMQARVRALYQKLVATKWETFVPIYHEQTPEEIAAKAEPRLKYMQELPYSVEFRQLSRDILRVEQQFGMTPASRSGIDLLFGSGGGPGGKPPEDETEKFLFGRRGKEGA